MAYLNGVSAKAAYMKVDVLFILRLLDFSLNPLDTKSIAYVLGASATVVSAHNPGKYATLIGDLAVS